jgi:hypothetical protein
VFVVTIIRIPGGSDEPDGRPKSWSPTEVTERKRVLRQTSEFSQLKDQSTKPRPRSYTDCAKPPSTRVPRTRPLRNVCWPYRNGETYSISPNKVVHLDYSEASRPPEGIVRSSSVKDRVSELENCQPSLTPSAKCFEDLPDRTGIVQSLANQFEAKGKPVGEEPSQTYCAKVHRIKNYRKKENIATFHWRTAYMIGTHTHSRTL